VLCTEIGDGVVARVARATIGEFHSPAVGPPSRIEPRYSRRGGGIRASAER
jgi:hypothetical protein